MPTDHWWEMRLIEEVNRVQSGLILNLKWKIFYEQFKMEWLKILSHFIAQIIQVTLLNYWIIKNKIKFLISKYPKQ